MQYIIINALPILLATLAGLAVSVVYATLIGSRRAVGVDRVAATTLAITAVAAQGWLACILAGALILAPPQAGAWTMALGSAVVIWLGFVLPSLFLSLRFRGARAGAALLDCGHWLTLMLAQASVLHLVGLTKPT